MIEKVGDNRTVKKILEVLNEKYSITKGEKILLLLKNISDFKTDEDMITETDRVNLATNLRYALSIQFIDRLEKSNYNSGEKLWLKDVIEDTNGEPKLGNIPQYLKKELKIMKVKTEEMKSLQHREYKTNYIKNDDNRSCYNDFYYHHSSHN